jgi:hypothetical protein
LPISAALLCVHTRLPCGVEDQCASAAASVPLTTTVSGSYGTAASGGKLTQPQGCDVDPTPAA